MKINVKYIPREESIEVEALLHDCVDNGHIWEEDVEFDCNTLEWKDGAYDLTNRPSEFGRVCKICNEEELYEPYDPNDEYEGEF